MLQNGYIQIYTGDGKGKTTASLGLALRALGHGWKVLMIQFTKGDNGANYYGEMMSASKFLPNFEVAQFGMDRVVYSHNVCIEDLLSTGSVKYYAKPEDEITIYRSVMIRKENAEALNKITQETGISLTRLVNIAMKEFLDKYNK